MKKNLHYFIYIIALVVSLGLIGLYFIDTQNAWCIISCSIGASLIGAIVLGFCIDLSNIKIQYNRILNFRNEKLLKLKQILLRILESIIKKFFIERREQLVNSKIYAIQYEDIKNIIIEEYSEKDCINYKSIKDKNLDFNYYFDNNSIFDLIGALVNRIVCERDLLALNEIFTQNELNSLNSVANSIPAIDYNSFENTIINITYIIDQLIEIKELSCLKNYYGVYDIATNHLSMCDDKGNAINRPLKIDFDIAEVITNGKDLFKGEAK